MGPGGSQEATYTLKAKVPAGTYHLVLDAIIVKSVDVTFDLAWRRGSVDTPLQSWTVHYDPLPGGNFDAQPFEYDEACAEVPWQKGDELVFRYTGANTTSLEAYIPNGDGSNANGRIPYIELP